MPRTSPRRYLFGDKPPNLLGEPLTSEIISWALPQSYAYDDFKVFFASHHSNDVKEATNGSVNGLPTMFSAIQNNDLNNLCLLIEYGGDPNVQGPSVVPLLALAVIQAKKHSTNTTEIVKTLLAFGVDPMAIPKELWDGYMKMPEDAIAATSSRTPAAASWYHSGYRDALVRNLFDATIFPLQGCRNGSSIYKNNAGCRNTWYHGFATSSILFDWPRIRSLGGF